MTDRDFDDLVNAIYESLVDETILSTVPDILAQYCGARSASLLICSSPDQLEKMLAVDYWPDDLWAEYQDHFADKDIWRQRLAALPPNQVHDLVPRHITIREFLDSEIYNDLARKYDDDTVHCMGAWLPQPTGSMAVVGLHRALRAGHFSPGLQHRLQRALPHLKRLALLWRTLGGTSRGPRLTERILDTLTAGVMILNEAGYILYHNQAADEMLGRNDGLGCRGGMLVAVEHDVAVKLKEIIARIVVHPTSDYAGALRVSRPSGHRAYQVVLVPLRQQLPSLSGEVLVVVDDPDRQATLLRSHLQSLFGLTVAEADLAAQLAEGRSLDQIACTREVAMSTIRAQMKAVLAKTDTNRQAELVSLVARLPKTR